VLFFTALDASATGLGRELWRSDGTAAGTYLVRDIYAGSGSGTLDVPGSLVAFQGKCWFTGTNGVDGFELWQSDGTLFGTKMFLDIATGPFHFSATPAALRVANGKLFFVAEDGAHGRELWTSDGTVAGTKLFVDVNQTLPALGSGSAITSLIVGASDRLWFAANDGVSGSELWTSDGTPAGTLRVKDINPGTASSAPSSFAVVGNVVYFAADDGSSGVELWKSDGSAAGTTLVKNIHPTGSALARQPLVRIGDNRILFAADDGTTGSEPWVSDGTAAGTVQVANLNPGAAASNPSAFFLFANKIVFSADNGVVAQEPHVMSSGTIGAALSERFGLGCAGTGGKVPAIASGMPVIGSATFAVTATNARATAPAALILGATRGSSALGGGCTLWVAAPQVLVNTTTDALGSASVGLPLASNPSWLGLEFYFQYAVLDPNGAYSAIAAFSDGLRILIGAP